MSTEGIPQTDSIEELARFWSSHDLTDFEGELEEVTDPVFERSHIVRVPLTHEEARAVRQLAESMQTDPGSLIRQWVREKTESGNEARSA